MKFLKPAFIDVPIKNKTYLGHFPSKPCYITSKIRPHQSRKSSAEPCPKEDAAEILGSTDEECCEAAKR